MLLNRPRVDQIIVLLCVGLLILIMSGHLFSWDSNNIPGEVNKIKSEGIRNLMPKMLLGIDGPNIVTDIDLPKVVPYSCMRSKIETKVHNHTWLVCAKNNYEYISQQIVSGGIWDAGSSILILDMMKKYPDAAYLDVGSNLGAFVTMAAQYGRRVYAVEPLKYNLAFVSTSLKLGNNEDKVVLINNAVSDDKIEMFPWQNNPNNEGYTILLPKEVAHTKPKHEILAPVFSVTLQQILDQIKEQNIVFKLDVEGAECKVLMEYLYTPKKTRFIPYIYMEWVHIHNNLNGMCPEAQFTKLIEGFALSGYIAMSKGDNGYTPTEPKNNMVDVVWVHKDAKPL